MTVLPAMRFAPPEQFESSRLLIRRVGEQDLADLLRVNGEDEVTRCLPYRSWKTMDDAKGWLGRIRTLEETGTGMQFAVVEKATLRTVGGVLLFRYLAPDRRAELGYVLGREHWGKGLMAEALGVVISDVFGAGLLRRLEAEVDVTNANSWGLLERLGFVQEGLLRQRWQTVDGPKDFRFYGLLSHEWVPPQGKGRA